MIYTLKFAAQIALLFVSFAVSYSIRRGLPLEWWTSDPLAPVVLGWAATYAAIGGGFELVYRNERTAWSYASIHDIGRLIQTTVLTTLTFLALVFISDRGFTLPRSTLLLSWMVSLFALVGVRIASRLMTEHSFRTFLFGLKPKAKLGVRPLVLVGDPRSVQAYLRREAADGAGYQPVAIVVGDGNLVGQAIQNIPVIGMYDRLEPILQAPPFRPGDKTAILFLKDPISCFGLSVDLIGRLRAEGRPLLRQPSLVELKASGGDALREISLEEFLPRAPVMLDPAPLERLVSGKRVLVTGAGGSIGSEICRQLVNLGCSHITLLDHSEFLLFEIDRDLASRRVDLSRRAILCDVRHADRLREVMKEERPEIVFHAAALKHVTLVEQNPTEAILTNILGTQNTARAAEQAGAAQFVLISTDKAVDPTSFMGATKRIAESSLPAANTKLRCCVVRFGNVLGSAGSVVPIFRSQIERGGPVTVTHRDVERYFMTIPEAVQLVLHAATISAASPIGQTRKFLLEMGQPVKIYDLARQMIELCGLRPDQDIRIEFIGLKPGEKLTEDLLDINETSRPLQTGLAELETIGDRVLVSKQQVQALVDAARSGEPDQAREQVMLQVAAIRGKS